MLNLQVEDLTPKGWILCICMFAVHFEPLQHWRERASLAAQAALLQVQVVQLGAPVVLKPITEARIYLPLGGNLNSWNPAACSSILGKLLSFLTSKNCLFSWSWQFHVPRHITHHHLHSLGPTEGSLTELVPEVLRQIERYSSSNINYNPFTIHYSLYSNPMIVYNVALPYWICHGNM